MYTDSVIALNADTGKLKWHYQFTPHDEYDWDANQIPVLINSKWNGAERNLMLWANANGFFYVLDRKTGKYLLSQPFVKQTWALKIDSEGNPIRAPHTEPTTTGRLVYPGSKATNWWSPSYSPKSKLFYVSFNETARIFFKNSLNEADERNSNGMLLGGAGRSPHRGIAGLKAINPTTGKIKWEFKLKLSDMRGHFKGLLTTASNLIFVSGGYTFYVLDAVTGEVLWQMNTGGEINSAPITYSIDGKQYVTISAGRTYLTFGM